MEERFQELLMIGLGDTQMNLLAIPLLTCPSQQYSGYALPVPENPLLFSVLYQLC